MRKIKLRSGKRFEEIAGRSSVSQAANLKARYRLKALREKPLMAATGLLGVAAFVPLLATDYWSPLYVLLACAALATAFFISLTAALAARGYANHLPMIDQHIRDIRANELYHQLKAGERLPAYSLYLRPFKSTNDLKLRPVSDIYDPAQLLPKLAPNSGGIAHRQQETPEMPVTMATDKPHLEFEGAVMASLATRAPMVCLGMRLEHVGAGRIEVADADWQEAVATLCAHAELIIVCPSQQAGTLWEIEHLAANDLIDRVVFVDMPEGGYIGGQWQQDREWGAIVTTLAKYGYELPGETRSGLFLYFGRQKTPLLATPIGKLEVSRLGEFFDAVIAESKAIHRP